MGRDGEVMCVLWNGLGVMGSLEIEWGGHGCPWDRMGRSLVSLGYDGEVKDVLGIGWEGMGRSWVSLG